MSVLPSFHNFVLLWSCIGTVNIKAHFDITFSSPQYGLISQFTVIQVILGDLIYKNNIRKSYCLRVQEKVCAIHV